MAVTEGQLISDGTAVWKVKKIGNGELPVGTIQMFAGNTIPAGWLLCDGSAISRTDYAKLFSAIGTIYGEGDGSTTFALPNLIDRFLQGSVTAGRYIEPGLPNIEGGRASYAAAASISPTGAFYYDREGTALRGNTTSDQRSIGFDASKSNSIYGNSTTVQPPALTMLPIIKY